MGGWGSGSFPRSQRPIAEDYPRIPVRQLAQHCKESRAVIAHVTLEQRGHRQSIALVSTPQPYGGVRWWFRCWSCSRKTPVLYLCGSWACRRCHKLDYRSHRLSAPERRRYRGRKLFGRLGLTGYEDWYPKPKWMRWHTFNAIIDEAEECDQAAMDWELRAIAKQLPRASSANPAGGVG